MKSHAHNSRFYQLLRYLRNLVAFFIILSGVIVGLISLILPNENLYQSYIVEFLNKQWDKKVTIDTLSGRWVGVGPEFVIDGLKIQDDQEIEIEKATLHINLFQFLLPGGATGLYLSINNIEADFERNDTGQIVLADTDEKKVSVSAQIEELLAAGTLFVNRFSLNIYDAINDRNNQINSTFLAKKIDDKKAFAIDLDANGLAENVELKAIADKQHDLLQQAKWYMQIDDLDLSHLGKMLDQKFLPSVMIDAKLWFSTEKSNITSLLAKLQLKTQDEKGVAGNIELVYQGQKKAWQAQLELNNFQLNGIQRDPIIIDLYRNDSVISLRTDQIDLILFKEIMTAFSMSNEALNQLEYEGQIKNLVIDYDVDLRRVLGVKVDFSQVSMNSDFGQFNNLSGSVSLQDEQIRILIDSDQGSALLPKFVRGEVQWDKLLLTAQTSMQDDDLDVKINSLWCDCNDFIVDGAARFTYSNELFLDLAFAVYDAQINQLYKYWPSIVWKPPILNFLDQALMIGEVKNGMILYHGPVKKYPFRGNEGVFITRSELINADINYHKEWPVLNDFNAIVSTLNQSLMVESQKGRVLDAQINDVDAVIKNMNNAVVEVDVKAEGQDNFLIDFLNQSPMKKGLDVLNEDMQIKGNQSVEVLLSIPLKNNKSPVIPDGRINFTQTNFEMGDFELTGMNGELAFKGFSLTLNGIDSVFMDRRVNVTGEIINQPNEPSSIDVLLKGRYDISDFEATLGFALPASGESNWVFSITNGQHQPLSFIARSDLVGVELDVPEPLLKPADQSSPFSMTCVLPCKDTGWYVSFDDRLETQFNLDLKTNDVELNKLNFGTFEEDFGGEIDVANVDEWIALLAQSESANNAQSLPFEKMAIHINKVIFMSRMLFDVDVVINRSKDGIIFDIDAQDIKGQIIVADDLKRKGVIVQLDKLHWKNESLIDIGDDEESISLNFPALHIRIDDFIYDGIPLGASTIEVRPVSDGVMVEKFDTKSDLMSLNINGLWQRNIGEKGLSQFNIIMTSPNIAEFLKSLGFDAPISQAKTVIDMKAEWPNFPSQFEIKDINGQMRVEIGAGEVVDAKPGVGRVLGLFSLTNLPRRLILDFRDVFSKGLRFELMQGDFILENGEAYTDSFVIDSTSAKIIVTGKTGLAKQDYNQTVTVTPRVGRVLPTIGAITGGAVGAAAGFFVQGLFRRDLKKVGKIVYKVTGSWDEPVINLIETEEL